jgi:hypothetical protein
MPDTCIQQPHPHIHAVVIPIMHSLVMVSLPSSMDSHRHRRSLPNMHMGDYYGYTCSYDMLGHSDEDNMAKYGGVCNL